MSDPNLLRYMGKVALTQITLHEQPMKNKLAKQKALVSSKTSLDDCRGCHSCGFVFAKKDVSQCKIRIGCSFNDRFCADCLVEGCCCACTTPCHFFGCKKRLPRQTHRSVNCVACAKVICADHSQYCRDCGEPICLDEDYKCFQKHSSCPQVTKRQKIGKKK